MIGGLGSDRLSGGRGADRFVYFALDESNAVDGIDTIRDFDPVEDSIDLSGLGGAILVSSYQPGLASMMQATLTHDLGRNTTTISIFNGSADAAFEIDVADHLSALTGISGIFAPLLVTFEDLGPYDGADTPVPNGYYGFD